MNGYLNKRLNNVYKYNIYDYVNLAISHSIKAKIQTARKENEIDKTD